MLTAREPPAPERFGEWNGFPLMVRKVLFVALVLQSCSNGAQADLPYVSQARSLAAEWALVNEEAGRGHLTTVYAQTMRESIREQLQTSSKSLTRTDGDYAREIALLLRAPDDAPPGLLKAHSGRLKQIEDKLESA